MKKLLFLFLILLGCREEPIIQKLIIDVKPIEWTRVKGKAENYILNKGFKDAYMFRAGVIIPEKGIKSRTPLYNFFYVLMWPFFPLMKLLPFITTTSKIGDAMIYTLLIIRKTRLLIT